MARLTIRSTKSTSPSPSAPRTFQPHQQRPSGSRYEGTTHTTESTSTDPSSTATPGRPRTSRTTDSSSLFAPTSSSTLAVASTSTSTLTLIKSGGGDSELNHEEVPEIEREAAVNTRLVSILEGDEEEEEGSDEEVQEVPNPALPSRQLRGDTYTAEVVQPAEELDSQLEESTTPASTPSSSSRLAFKKKERTLWSKLTRTCTDFLTSIPTPTLLDVFTPFVGSGSGSRRQFGSRKNQRLIIRAEYQDGSRSLTASVREQTEPLDEQEEGGANERPARLPSQMESTESPSNDDEDGDQDEASEGDDDTQSNATPSSPVGVISFPVPPKTEHYTPAKIPPPSFCRTITSLPLDRLLPSDVAVVQSRSLVHLPKKKMTLLFQPIPSQPNYWDSVLQRPSDPPKPMFTPSLDVDEVPPGRKWMRRPLKRTYAMYDIMSKEEGRWIRWVEEKEVEKGVMKKRVEVVRKMREEEERRGVGRQLTKRRVWTGKLSGGVDNGGSEIEEKGDEKNEKEGVEETEGQTNEDEDDTNEVPFKPTSLVAEQVLDQEGEVEEEGASNAEAGDQNATDEESDEEGEEGSDDTVRPRRVIDITRNDEEESDDTDTEETIGVVRPSTTTAIPKARPRRPLKRSRGPEEEEEPPTPVAGPSSEVDRRPVRSRRRL